MTDSDSTPPLQQDMFSGELKDTRTRSQKKADKARNDWQQTEMFRQRDIAQFGVRAYRVMDLNPGKLTLIMEDPRTEEEKAADQQREAESRTAPMFAADEVAPAMTKPQDEVNETVKYDASEPTLPHDSQLALPVERQERKILQRLPHQRHCDKNTSQNTSRHAYLTLVEIVREQKATEWIDPAYKGAFDTQLIVAMMQASQAGLQPEEITNAVRIGRSLAYSAMKEEASAKQSTQEAQLSIGIPIIVEPGEVPASQGLRAQLRQECVTVRRRG